MSWQRLSRTCAIALAVGLAASVNVQALSTEVPACRLMFPSVSQNSSVVGEKPTGPFVDTVAEIFSRANVPMEPMPYAPWTRAVALTELGRFDGLAIAMKTPERVTEMVFVGPFLEQSWSIFRLKERPLPTSRNPRIGVQTGFARLTPVKQVLDTAGAEVVELASARLDRMMIDGKIDAILSTDASMEIWANSEKRELARIENSQTVVPTFIALKKSSECAMRQPELQSAIEAWVSDGGRETFQKAFLQP